MLSLSQSRCGPLLRSGAPCRRARRRWCGAVDGAVLATGRRCPVGRAVVRSPGDLVQVWRSATIPEFLGGYRRVRSPHIGSIKRRGPGHSGSPDHTPGGDIPPPGLVRRTRIRGRREPSAILNGSSAQHHQPRTSACSSTDRASDYGSEGLGFESLQARNTDRPPSSRDADGGLSCSALLRLCSLTGADGTAASGVLQTSWPSADARRTRGGSR